MGIARLAIIVVPFKYLSRILGEKMAESPDSIDRVSYRKAAVIGWTVEKMSWHTPWESKCLVKAITAQIFLRLRGLSSTLYLGLDRDQDRQLSAHAWLRCGELYVTGAQEKESFRAVAQFACLGRKDKR
jgi:hypothetical protein